jgi:hypothetical protein
MMQSRPSFWTKLLRRVRRLPPSSRDEIVRAMLDLAGNEGEREAIDPAHLPSVLEGLAGKSRSIRDG